MVNYNKDLKVALRLFDLDPGNTQFQRDVIISNFKLGNFYEEQGYTSKALSYFQAAQVQVVEMGETGKLAPEDSWISQDLEERIAGLQKK